ncbi:MAG: hypothetical protein C0490_01115 [Marivirga sp.]|nr:hypothetical protein [Marivirga sp.]
MKFRTFVTAVFLFSAAAGYCQDNQQTKGFVLYDPLFWKDQLKLDAFQCQKIREINSQYYEKLSAVIHEEKNRNKVKVKAAESLQQRSEEIWETFYPKQRKRWKKIWEHSSNTI